MASTVQPSFPIPDTLLNSLSSSGVGYVSGKIKYPEQPSTPTPTPASVPENISAPAPAPAPINPPVDVRVAELQAKADLLKAGIKWSRDSKGGLVVSNIDKNPPGVASTKDAPIQEATTLEILRKKMQEIQTIADPGQKLNEIATMQGIVAGYVGKRMTELTARANQEIGVDALRKQLEDNIRMDKNTPAYVAKYGNADSSETEAVRQRYQSAIASATALSEKYIKDNPEINSILGESKTFLTIQANIAAKDQDRVAKLKDLGDGIRQVATWIDPKVTDEGIVANANKYFKLLELKDSPIALVQDVVEGRTPGAPTILINAQTEAMVGAGNSADPAYKKLKQEAFNKATDQVNTLMLIATDVEAFQTALATFTKGASTPEDAIAVKRLNSVITLAKGDPKRLDEIRKDFAFRFISYLGKSEFLNNVDSWRVKDTTGGLVAPFQVPGSPLQLLYKDVKKDTPVVSVSSLIANIRKLPKEQQPLAEVQLKEAMRNSLQFASGGYFGRFTTSMNVDDIFHQELAKNVLTSMDIFNNTLQRDIAAGAAIGGVVGLFPAPITGGLSIPALASVGALGGGLAGLVSGLPDLLSNSTQENK